MEIGNKKNPPPDNSVNKEPDQDPNTSPSTGQHQPATGQHQPDIMDEKLRKKHGNRPQVRENINPEEFPNGNPEEYNDGAPVEEKSPRVSNSSL
jgi:hypothetical protein